MRKFHCVNILILFWIIPFQLKSQETQIVGKALDYSGKEITFYTIPDPILSQKVILGTAKVAKDGSFFFKFSVSGTIEIYSELEKYCGTMVVEPGKKYSVV